MLLAAAQHPNDPAEEDDRDCHSYEACGHSPQICNTTRELLQGGTKKLDGAVTCSHARRGCKGKLIQTAPPSNTLPLVTRAGVCNPGPGELPGLCNLSVPRSNETSTRVSCPCPRPRWASGSHTAGVSGNVHMCVRLPICRWRCVVVWTLLTILLPVLAPTPFPVKKTLCWRHGESFSA